MTVCLSAGLAAPLMLAGALYLHDGLGHAALRFLSRRNVILHQQCNVASLSTANDLGGQAKYKKYVSERGYLVRTSASHPGVPGLNPIAALKSPVMD